jgi:hypothetical protein
MELGGDGALLLRALLWLRGFGRGAIRSNMRDPFQFVGLVAPPGRALPPQWYGTPWPGTRGVVATADRNGPRNPPRRPIGGSGACRPRHDSTVGQLTAEIVDLIEGLPAGSPVAAVYRDLGRRAAAGEAPDARNHSWLGGRGAATKLAGADLVQLGAWAEGGRLAVAQRNASFFQAQASRTMLARASARFRLAGRGSCSRTAAAFRPASGGAAGLERAGTGFHGVAQDYGQLARGNQGPPADDEKRKIGIDPPHRSLRFRHSETPPTRQAS